MTRPAVDTHVQPPADVLAGWMRTAQPGDLQPRLLRLPDGRLLPLPVERWAGPVDAADESMLTRAHGPVLDVGCGPGRLTAALHERGVRVLGLELLPEVPSLAYAVGAPVLVGDVFGTVPGTWRTVLLADGNVGIGGDPVVLLRRLRGLLAPGGQVVCELSPEAHDGGSGAVRLEGLGVTSAWFRWAMLGRRGLPAVAAAAGLAVQEAWDDGPRAFATLTPV